MITPKVALIPNWTRRNGLAAGRRHPWQGWCGVDRESRIADDPVSQVILLQQDEDGHDEDDRRAASG